MPPTFTEFKFKVQDGISFFSSNHSHQKIINKSRNDPDQGTIFGAKDVTLTRKRGGDKYCVFSLETDVFSLKKDST